MSKDDILQRAIESYMSRHLGTPEVRDMIAAIQEDWRDCLPVTGSELDCKKKLFRITYEAAFLASITRFDPAIASISDLLDVALMMTFRAMRDSS